MASQQTPNYKLSRWAGTDRILMEEFNDNWDKIDTALKAKNCQFYTTTYQGDGSDSRTHTFPAKPIFVLIYSLAHIFIMTRNAEKGVNYLAGRADNYDTTWAENSVTLSRSGSFMSIANDADLSYNLFAILDADTE